MCLASKYLSQFDSLLNNIEEDIKKLNDKQSEYDKQISQVYHRLETSKFNACEGFYISKQLQELLRKRRLVKIELSRLRNICNTIQVPTVIKQLPKARASVKKSQDGSKEWVDTFGFTFSDIEEEILH